MKILNFGSCNIDYVYSLDHIVRVGETETTHSFETFPGGKGLNQSIALSKAGAKVWHAGLFGEGSSMLEDILTENGVDISLIKRVPEKNGHAIIQVSKVGENSIFVYPGANEMITKEYIDNVLSNFSQDDIILLQNEINNVDYIVEKAYEKKMCIILNPSPYNERIKKIDFNKLSYIILNEVEAAQISGCDDTKQSLEAMKKKNPKLKIMLTLGINGCVYSDSQAEFYQPAFMVNAVDTTAAGDTFTGYFIAELARGTSYQEILKTASAASAIAVSRKGAAPSIPSKEEVLSSIDGLKKPINSRAERLNRQIESYIEKNIKTATVKGLAKELGYSAVYTGNLVKKLSGKSFSELLQGKRIKIAAENLLNTDFAIEKVISDVGYENKGYFRQIFMKKYGKNPLEFRKNGDM